MASLTLPLLDLDDGQFRLWALYDDQRLTVEQVWWDNRTAKTVEVTVQQGAQVYTRAIAPGSNDFIRVRNLSLHVVAAGSSVEDGVVIAADYNLSWRIL